MQRADHRFYGFLTGRVFPCGQLLQQGNGVLKAQAALLDESRILRPYIAPVPRLIGDLGDGFGVLGIPHLKKDTPSGISAHSTTLVWTGKQVQPNSVTTKAKSLPLQN